MEKYNYEMGMDAKHKLLNKIELARLYHSKVLLWGKEVKSASLQSSLRKSALDATRPRSQLPFSAHLCHQFCTKKPSGLCGHATGLQWDPKLLHSLSTDGWNRARTRLASGVVQISVFHRGWMSLFWPDNVWKNSLNKLPPTYTRAGFTMSRMYYSHGWQGSVFISLNI